ncbi:MAG TPA: hypothetical protein VGG48_17425 [Rhizomicrobium sp.]|jgi:hypothetical protein
MTATTVVTDEATIISEDTPLVGPFSDFSWGAALAGAVITAATAFFLLTLGAGFGLALTTAPKLMHGSAPTFLTLGAVYFFAALAFSFAIGAHVAGRLIGPVLETRKEEEFRAGAHGLAVWAIAVVATATMIGIGAFVAEGAVPAAMTASRSPDGMTPLATGYWVDTLFRTGTQMQASLDGVQYAQTAQTTGTDAAPSAQPEAQQQQAPATDDESSQGSGATVTPQSQRVMPSDIQVPQSSGAAPTTSQPAATDTTMGTPAPGRNVAADKMEAGRILDVDMAKAGDMPADDRVQLAQLVSLDTGLNTAAAQRRVDDVVARIRADAIQAAETARKIASYASLWAAFALLFGAIVSVMAAISARWEDDRIRLFGD